MDAEFKNKTVVLTGAAREIGEGIATRFAKAGANLVIADYADEMTSTAKHLQARKCSDSSVCCNASRSLPLNVCSGNGRHGIETTPRISATVAITRRLPWRR